MNKVICKQCNKEFEAHEKTRIFCSLSCSSVYNNTGRVKRTLKYCLYCSKLLDNNKKTYCNASCHHSSQRKVKISAGLELCNSQFIRKILIDRHGAKCMKCGWSEVNQSTGKVPIEINHIDGNSSNNSQNNLELLCPNCHSLTPNYRALNRGNGRHNRRMRYKNGQSY